MSGDLIILSLPPYCGVHVIHKASGRSVFCDSYQGRLKNVQEAVLKLKEILKIEESEA